MEKLAQLQELIKAVQAGNYDVAPRELRQGPAIAIEDCSPQYYNQTYEDKDIKLQKELTVKKARSQLVQFVRTLGYGGFGGSAQLEGAVGRERTSDRTRVTVPMCYYSEIRRVTVAATLIETQGGEKIEDLEAEAGDLNLAGDIELDLFRGCDDFSNAGVFDGNPAVIPAALPNIRGLQVQIRQADSQLIAQDLMFLQYGAGMSSAVPVNGPLTQTFLEDISVRSAMNQGTADKFVVDPLVHSQYNKEGINKERIVLAGSPTDSIGTDLRRQWTMNSTVQVESSRFLSGKFRPAAIVDGAPNVPASITLTQAAGTTGFTLNQIFNYYVTAANENGEGPATAASAITISTTGNQVQVAIAAPAAGAAVRFYNVYRTVAGGAATTAKFIGRMLTAGATTNFLDLGNKLPGFVTGVLYQGNTMFIAELSPYSRMKLAVADLSLPEAHFRFLTLAVGSPKKNVIGDNLRGATVWY